MEDVKEVGESDKSSSMNDDAGEEETVLVEDELNEEHDDEINEETGSECSGEMERHDDVLTLRRSQRNKNKPTSLTYDEVGGKPVFRPKDN